MAPEALKLMRKGWFAAALLLLLLVVLHLTSNAVQDVDASSRYLVPLLMVTVAGLVALAMLIVLNAYRLWREYKEQKAGSRLTLRMVVVFLSLSLPPGAVVYYYSMGIMTQGIDRWFDVDIGGSVDHALELSKVSLDLHKREKLRLTGFLMQSLEDSSETALSLTIDELRERFDVFELQIVDFDNRVIATSSASTTELVLVPTRIENDVVRQAKGGEPFVDLDPSSEEDTMLIRVVLADPRGRPFLMQALYHTSAEISDLSGKVQQSYQRYRELAYLRDSLKFSFGLTLFLVLMFAFLSAIWAAFFSARRLVAPVSQIAEGTRAVAEGRYDKQIPLPAARDDLSFLVSSFNSMTRSISLAREMADRSQQEVETQRAYLETVLGRLSSGVMAFDSMLCLQTANPAAQSILGVDLEELTGQPLYQLAVERPSLETFVDAMEKPLNQTHGEWRDEITLLTGEGRQVLLTRVSPLATPGDEGAGHVVVFDDVTALLQAQKNAAWGGVARRLAHEIKNPLTPIQLSAERLRRKFSGKLPEDESNMLDRATGTIIHQVDAMKELVNAFSDYARPPKMQAEPIQFDEFINQVLDLYRAAGSGPKITVELNAGDARIEADPGRLRQVVVNLVKNAQEALEETEGGEIVVASCLGTEAESGFVALEVRDNGTGFKDEALEHLFEPYVTTKVKGSGLGLAIVKKIVEEHSGIIRADNLKTGGARILMFLPLMNKK